jgi:hypothetical protein
MFSFLFKARIIIETPIPASLRFIDLGYEAAGTKYFIRRQYDVKKIHAKHFCDEYMKTDTYER